MRHEEFRRALEEGNVRLIRRMWAAWFPKLPQPDAKGAEIQMHMARTSACTIGFKLRAYSHRWLTERGFPSQLPDHLKPKAERIYPRVVEGVGISVNFRSPWMKPAAVEVRKAMEDVVLDMYANGDTDPILVRKRIFEAKDKAVHSLFGRR